MKPSDPISRPVVLLLLLMLWPIWLASAAPITRGRVESRRFADSSLTNVPAHFDKMSSMGRLAYLVAEARAQQPHGGAGTSFHGHLTRTFTPNGDEGDDDEGEGPTGGQSEVSIAVDATGQHIVVGFNDTRGFGLNPVGISGFAYSDDGGATFTDGGQLPTSGNASLNGSISGTFFPQVFGDPDVKYIPGGGGLQFVYASIMVKGLGTAPNFTGTAQTLCIHRSFNGGHTWQGPFEITAATNPTGVIQGSNARDAADKEFIDIDPDSGRVLASWSSFTSSAVISGGVQISTAYSDDVLTGNPPTWSARSVLNSGASSFDTGSIPRFAGNLSNEVYVTWSRSSATVGTPYGGWSFGNIGFAKSINNGVSWAPAVNLTTDFFPIDYILGNDRVHSFPGLAVDNSSGGGKGNVYVVYVSNPNKDGGDIVFQRSTDRGSSFSAPILLNSRPGADRPQWFPMVSVDSSTGRINVVYDDEGIATSGDLMEMTWIYSDDGGVTWSKPSPLNSSPFHAGYGNDTGQPNLGDYNGLTTRTGSVYAAFSTTPEFSFFTNGQPASQFTYPSFLAGANPGGFRKSAVAPIGLRLGAIVFSDNGGNGFIDRSETIQFTLPLFNYVTNGISSPVTYTGVSATLSTTNPGVTIVSGTQFYPNIAPGSTGNNLTPFSVQLQDGFVTGTRLEFSLAVNTAQGTSTLLFSEPTGTPIGTTVFSENFNGVSAGSLPAGWTTSHGGGNNIVAWTTSSSVPGAPNGNALFHVNARDGIANNPTRWERIFSPSIAIPAGASYATLDFDVWYNTEDDPDFNVLAYDGCFLRLIDLTPGRSARTCLAEAFAQDFTTGSTSQYPKHLPRNSSPGYFEDMSVWGGYSGGWQHVQMKLPGTAGSTFQLIWEFTQDNVNTGTDVHPSVPVAGVAVDSIVVKSVVLESTPLLTWPLPGSITYGTALSGAQLNATASVPGTFVYSPTSGTVLNSGSNLLSVIFTPSDSVNYTSATGAVSLIVLPPTLTATAQNAMRAYGQPNPPFSVSLVGVTNGDNITATATCGAVTGSPPGAYPIVPVLVDPANRQANYQVSLINGSLTVTPAAVLLTWTNPAAILYGTALSSTQLNASASTPGSFVYTPGTGAVLPAGTNSLTVVFTPTDSGYSSTNGGVSLVVLPYLIYNGIDLTNSVQALADPDGDGIANLMEYALGLDPHNPADTQDGMVVSLVSNGGNQYLLMQYRRRTASPALPLYYVPEVSGDRLTWYSDPTHLTETSIVGLDPQFDWVTVQDLTPTTPATPRLIRLRVGEN